MTENYQWTIVNVLDGSTEHASSAQLAREEFVSMVLNSLPEEIVVIDAQGVILAVNESWQRFAEKNGGNFNAAMPIGMNYLDSCRIGAAAGDPYAAEMLARLEDLILGRANTCSVEYPCHSPNRQQWFVMNARQSVRLPRLIVISHLDITARKEAEEALRQREEQLKQFNVELERKVTERTAKLLESEDRLRALATELNLAEQRERKRLAIELHDHLQQMLVLGKIKLGQGKRLAAPIPACVTLMKETDEVLSDALAYTRTLVADLSPTVLRDHGLAVGLLWLAEYMQKHGTAVTVRVSDHEVTLPDDQKILLFQSVRELLINASKHAGTAQAAVSIEQRDGELRIDVCDEGVGFDLTAAAVAGTSNDGISSKFGLFSIQERMRALGGSFNIHSAPGQGTTATLMLPLRRK